MNFKDDFILSQITEGYLVGGSVRDALMGKNSVDRDIAIKDAENFAKKLCLHKASRVLSLRRAHYSSFSPYLFGIGTFSAISDRDWEFLYVSISQQA